MGVIFAHCMETQLIDNPPNFSTDTVPDANLFLVS